MKLGRIAAAGPEGEVARLVAVVPGEERVIDLASAERLRLERRGASPAAARRLAAALFPSSMAAAIALGETFLDAAVRDVEAAGDDASQPLAGLRWLPPLDPPLLRDCMAFERHVRNAFGRIGRHVPPEIYQLPVYYKGNPATLIGPEAEVPWPGYTSYMDYELELGFVVGKGGRDLTPDEARSYLFGVTILNDFSARDV
ncbi:MAG: fumarylacetoacetate hydrolase family protein, partial [Chloroflexi bacterium]|nr:fumarylacetoacetate hydrolase family protein [Chloroflexota bacterium]